jgi:ankyrin repeat protein
MHSSLTSDWTGTSWQEQGFFIWERFWSPLHGAAFSKHRDIVQLLLECGHDCGCKGVALMSAVGNGDVPMMRMLIAHGADVNGEYSGEGRHSRPVEEAIQRGSLEALQLFVQSGANIQDSDLVAAARSGKEVDVLHFLMDLGLEDKDDAALMAAAASVN